MERFHLRQYQGFTCLSSLTSFDNTFDLQLTSTYFLEKQEMILE